jgi:phage gpG-like protein
MSKINKTPDFMRMADELREDAVRYASVEGVNFFQNSFYNQGWTDEGFEAWQQRANDVDPGRKILIKSAFLSNSIQVFNANKERIVFGSDAEYAEIHNNGGVVSIPITAKSRKYFWFMYMETNNSMWKALALTKKESITITIPKRQFIGESATFMRQLDTWLLNTIKTRFKQL